MPMTGSFANRSKKADFSEIVKFAELSNDFNPLHVDRAFAAKTAYGDVIAHGPMSTGLLLNVIDEALGSNLGGGLSISLRMLRPVREGDLVNTGSEVSGGSEARAIWVENQKGERVIDGRLAILPEKPRK
jgi:acyl dehydratase